jgi:ornithine carbamoyltransferase
MHRDLLTIEEVSTEDLSRIFELSAMCKRCRATRKDTPLEGKSVGLVFSKSSTRTRVSFEVGVRELGGFPIFLDQEKLQTGRGETIPDTARVLSRYLHAVVIRTHKHADIVDFAKHSNIPVINALTDEYHPCQALTDLFTMYEFSERLEGVKLAFLGDGASNMANTLILAARLAGLDLRIAAPEEFKPSAALMARGEGRGSVVWEPDPVKAVEGADYLYTDVWVSMGFESESARRMDILRPYQLNSQILSRAAANAKVLHCLPAHRGEEITNEVIECPQSVVFDQAENRLHVQKAILSMMMGGGE